MKRIAVVFLLIVSAALLCSAQSKPEWREWNQPVAPFRIAGNIYYVGASDITSYLITSSQGHILLDGGFPETAPMIEANIEKLGFHVRDVRVLLNSHAHFDHAGGLAELKRATRARLLIASGDADLIARGGHNDFAFGDSMLFPAVKPDGLVKDGENIRVGDAVLTAHITPGHTRGCTTWTTTAIDSGKRYDVTFLCSVSAPGYTLVNNAKYPNIVADYHASFARLRQIHTDIFLGSHGRFFDLTTKRAASAEGKPNPFIVPGEFARFIDQAEKDLDDQVRKQQAAAQKK